MRITHRGVSLIEVLIGIGIIGVLVGITLPAVQRARSAATRTSCQNNMRQIGIALQNHHSLHQSLPPRSNAGASDPNTILSWMANLLPQLEQSALFKQCESACRLDPTPTNNPPHLPMTVVVKTFVCPADNRLNLPRTDSTGDRSSFVSYIGIGGILPRGASRGYLGVFGRSAGNRFSEVTDGLSQTIMVGERPPPDSWQAGWWYPAYQGSGNGFRGPHHTMTLGGLLLFAGDPCDKIDRVFGLGRLENPCDRFHLWSLHSGGANFLFGDGSVRYLPHSAEAVVVAMASRDGGESVELP